jgi:RNA polymerase sigma-70 factor (sigma-E family)
MIVAVESVTRDPDAFDVVYASQYVPLVRLAYLTTASAAAAEDLVQDAFGEWLRRRDSVREPAAYLRRAVVSRSTSWVRRQRLERRYRAWTRSDTDAPQHGEADSDAIAVRAALQVLNARQRAAVFLRYYLDLPEADIAAALGCRPGTVKSLLHRSLATLRSHLDEEGAPR